MPFLAERESAFNTEGSTGMGDESDESCEEDEGEGDREGVEVEGMVGEVEGGCGR